MHIDLPSAHAHVDDDDDDEIGYKACAPSSCVASLRGLPCSSHSDTTTADNVLVDGLGPDFAIGLNLPTLLPRYYLLVLILFVFVFVTVARVAVILAIIITTSDSLHSLDLADEEANAPHSF